MGEDLDHVPRSALPAPLADEFRRRVLREPGCVKFTLVRHRGLGPRRESLKPVLLRGVVRWQSGRSDGKQVSVRNHEPGEEAAAALEAMLAETGAREYHLVAAGGDLHVRVTKKGKALVSRGKPPQDAAAPGGGSAPPAVRAHDREKDQPLGRFDSAPLLRVLGMAGGQGDVRAGMRAKAGQINAFLREIDAVLESRGARAGEPLDVVDCGCGRAYLTLSAYCYLTCARGLAVRVRGVDRNAEIVRKASAMAEALDVGDDVRFVAADIADCELDVRPWLVLGLHACDVATDLAIARGVGWGASGMLVAPCCQHDVQAQMAADSGPMRALMRHGVLRERFADLATDAFRAQILRIMGYRVKVVEFVSPGATPRNIMIRAESGVRPGNPATVGEYLEMRDFLRVTPALETLLGERLARLL